MAWWRHGLRRHFAVLAALWFVLYLPLLLGRHVLPWDAIGQFYPTVYFNAHSLRHGIAPWWNPYIYSGYPQIADPQGMLFSPLLMGWMLIPASPGATWFVWGVLLHLLMGACAMLALLRRMDASGFGSLVGSLVYMVGGVAASRLEHVPIVIVYGYLPVCLLALRHFLASPGWGRGALLGLALGAMATQLVQLTYLAVLMLAAYGVTESAWHFRAYRPAERWRWLGGLLVASLVATAIALPQLVLSLAFAGWSNRAALPLDAAGPASLEWRSLLSFFDPNVFHALRGEYDGPGSLVEAFFYVGALPALLLLGAGAAWKAPLQRRQLIFFLGIAIVSALYMAGVHGFLYPALYQWLPGIRLFRRPSDSAYLLNFAIAIWVGLAASHVRLESPRVRLGLLASCAIWLLYASASMRDPAHDWPPVTLFAACIAGVAMWQVWRQDTHLVRIAAWMLLVIVADYSCFNLNGTFNEASDSARYFRRNATVAFIAKDIANADDALPPRIESLDAGALWDNMVVLAPFSATQGYNPLRLGLYDQWYGARESSMQPRPVTPYNASPDSALSHLLGIRYLLRNVSPHQDAMPGYERVYADDRSEAWRNTHAYARLLTPTVARMAPTGGVSPEAFAATDFNDTVWITPRDPADRDAAEQSMATCTGGRMQVVGAEHTPTQLDIRTRGEQAGWLALGDLDFPGWAATVDGQEVPIHRANGMFRAVCLPAGTHAVSFQFHPWRMVAAAWDQRGH